MLKAIVSRLGCEGDLMEGFYLMDLENQLFLSDAFANCIFFFSVGSQAITGLHYITTIFLLLFD